MRTGIWMMVLLPLACGRPAARLELETAAPVRYVATPPAEGEIRSSGDGSPERPFASLAEAARLAPEGSLLLLGEGDYPERVRLTRPLVLMGRGPARTRIVAPLSSGEGPVLAARGPFPVELRGLAVVGGSDGVLLQQGRGHVLFHVVLQGQSGISLRLEDAEATVRESEFHDIVGGAVVAAGGALRIHRSLLRNAGRRAIVLRGTRARLEDVSVSGSAVGAVHALDGAHVSVRRGLFSGQGGAALYARAGFLEVQGSRIEHNEYGILAFQRGRIAVESTEVVDQRIASIAIVQATGSVRRSLLVRGGLEGGISVVSSTAQVLVEDTRILEPGTIGVHATSASVLLRGSLVRGATVDKQGDLGDGIYALESTISLEGTVLRGNQGSGAELVRSTILSRNSRIVANRRAGILLYDDTRAIALANVFADNGNGIQIAEGSDVGLGGNRFDDNLSAAIDGACGEQVRVRQLSAPNTYTGPAPRRSACP